MWQKQLLEKRANPLVHCPAGITRPARLLTYQRLPACGELVKGIWGNA
ncbi:hypothetical protein MRBBS_0961 [Marinobacter sp. BSs20148]|nr:hypothetical protein MRBBS_0961 [Marinobacter sp. BSs20148]